jgi:hypothetical protein
MRLLGLALAFVVAAGVFGCRPSNSPRLEAIRPHLKAGASDEELMKLTEKWPSRIGDPKEMLKKNQVILLLELDGTKAGMWLKLAFGDKKLASAAVVKNEKDGRFTEVDEVIVAERAGERL